MNDQGWCNTMRPKAIQQPQAAPLRKKKVICMLHKMTIWEPDLAYSTFVLRWLAHKECELTEIETNNLF